METEKPKIEFCKRNSAFTSLNQFCHLSGPNDYMEITQWANLEGIDIIISDKIGNRMVSITDGELKALKKLVKFLNKEEF